MPALSMRRRKPDCVFKQKHHFLFITSEQFVPACLPACQLRNIAIYLAQFKMPCHYCEMRTTWTVQRCAAHS
jgi:hypothetical protein